MLDYVQDSTSKQSDMDGKERETFMDLLAALLVSEEFQGIVSSSEPGSLRDSEQAAKSRDGENAAAAADTGTVSNSSTGNQLLNSLCWLPALYCWLACV